MNNDQKLNQNSDQINEDGQKNDINNILSVNNQNNIDFSNTNIYHKNLSIISTNNFLNKNYKKHYLN